MCNLSIPHRIQGPYQPLSGRFPSNTPAADRLVTTNGSDALKCSTTSSPTGAGRRFCISVDVPAECDAPGQLPRAATWRARRTSLSCRPRLMRPPRTSQFFAGHLRPMGSRRCEHNIRSERIHLRYRIHRLVSAVCHDRTYNYWPLTTIQKRSIANQLHLGPHAAYPISTPTATAGHEHILYLNGVALGILDFSTVLQKQQAVLQPSQSQHRGR